MINSSPSYCQTSGTPIRDEDRLAINLWRLVVDLDRQVRDRVVVDILRACWAASTLAVAR